MINRDGPQGTRAALLASNPDGPAVITHEVAQAPPGPDQTRSAAHGLHTVGYQLKHAVRHLDAASSAPDDAGRSFNVEHAANHARNAAVAHAGLVSAVGKVLPGVSDELAKLSTAVPDSHREAPAPIKADPIPATDGDHDDDA